MIRSYSFKIHLQTITINLFKGLWHVFEMSLHKKNHVILHGKRKCGLFPKASWVTSCSNSQSPILVNCHDVTPGIFDW